MRWILLAIFALTYAAISARRLQLLPVGRPAVALIGACLMVALGALAGPHGLPPEEALASVEPSTIALLTGMMLLAAALDVAGFFERASGWVLSLTRRPVPLLYAVAIGSGLLSALLVNDAVCLLATPLVMTLCARTGAPRLPFVLAVAMGANAGSAMTLAGNPQNMLVARLSGLSYARYLAVAGPAGLVALLLTAALIHAAFRRSLQPPAASGQPHPPAPSPAPWRGGESSQEGPLSTELERGRSEPPAPGRGEAGSAQAGEKPPKGLLELSLLALAGVTVAALLGAHLAFSALTGAAVALLAARQAAPALFPRVDWTVLVFFGGLFIVVAALRKTGLPDEALAALTRAVPPRGPAGLLLLCGVLLGGSQIVSNVPLILLLEPWIRGFPDATLAWTLTALVSTLAGNLTLLGSVANLIVIERAHAQDEVGFWSYTRVGLPVTLLSTAAALAVARALG